MSDLERNQREWDEWGNAVALDLLSDDPERVGRAVDQLHAAFIHLCCALIGLSSPFLKEVDD